MSQRKKIPANVLAGLEKDPAHHLAGPFLPQTPLGSNTPVRNVSPVGRRYTKPHVSPWLRWAVQPFSAFKLLVLPIILYFNWEIFTPFLAKIYGPLPDLPNPFGALFLISHRVTTSSPDDPRYAKGYCDLLFIAYNVVFFSFLRQILAVNISRRVAKYFGLKKEEKLERFGEQFYAIIYWGFMGAWGCRIMAQLPTYWYQTEYFWIGYPHWDMKPELKRYYLMQISFWLQQLFVLLLKLERPRKDYYELVAHHFVTIWLVGWSYFVNLTIIGNAVYASMDIPDTFLALSKLLNYIQWERAKVFCFAILIGTWIYFRHYLNFYILWSVWYQYDLIPDESKQWDFAKGIYLNWWMKYQVFVPLFLLQLLNLFWCFLILRILYRGIFGSVLDDERSDDEDEDEDRKKK